MKYYSFQIVIEKEPEDPGYMAYCPGLPGCFSNGATIEDTKKNIRQAIEQHLESLLEQKAVIPQQQAVIHVEELSIGFPE